MHALVDRLAPTLPPGVTIDLFGDAAAEVEHSLGTLYTNAAVGLLLVLLIVLSPLTATAEEGAREQPQQPTDHGETPAKLLRSMTARPWASALRVLRGWRRLRAPTILQSVATNGIGGTA